MLSILIVNWNTREMLRACLTSIVSKQVQIPTEIIVVDNASHDGSAAMVAADFPSVKLIRAPGNLGYAEGNNLAFAAAKGSWLLTLNPDTEVPAGVLDSAVLTLAQHQDCASLSVKFIGPEGEIQQSVRGFPHNSWHFRRFAPSRPPLPHHRARRLYAAAFQL
jgi:GT2 family glycosyltransferase